MSKSKRVELPGASIESSTATFSGYEDLRKIRSEQLPGVTVGDRVTIKLEGVYSDGFKSLQENFFAKKLVLPKDGTATLKDVTVLSVHDGYQRGESLNAEVTLVIRAQNKWGSLENYMVLVQQLEDSTTVKFINVYNAEFRYRQSTSPSEIVQRANEETTVVRALSEALNDPKQKSEIPKVLWERVGINVADVLRLLDKLKEEHKRNGSLSDTSQEVLRKAMSSFTPYQLRYVAALLQAASYMGYAMFEGYSTITVQDALVRLTDPDYGSLKLPPTDGFRTDWFIGVGANNQLPTITGRELKPLMFKGKETAALAQLFAKEALERTLIAQVTTHTLPFVDHTARKALEKRLKIDSATMFASVEEMVRILSDSQNSENNL